MLINETEIHLNIIEFLMDEIKNIRREKQSLLEENQNLISQLNYLRNKEED